MYAFINSIYKECGTPCGPDGSEGTTTRETGGTGQAIRMAKKRGIKVMNLANQSTLAYVKVWLGL